MLMWTIQTSIFKFTEVQHDLIIETVKHFLVLINDGLRNRFESSFDSYKQFYGEVMALRASTVAQISPDSKIRFLYLAAYNGLEHSKLTAEFKIFAEEFNKMNPVDNGKKCLY